MKVYGIEVYVDNGTTFKTTFMNRFGVFKNQSDAESKIEQHIADKINKDSEYTPYVDEEGNKGLKYYFDDELTYANFHVIELEVF